jgi:nucleotide-binding universal stress UspA family protein
MDIVIPTINFLKNKEMKTIKMKKIMIALDYDPTAKKVAEIGYLLAKSMGAEVVLLHVVLDPVYYSTMDYSPIMGPAGTVNMAPLQLDSIDGLNDASQRFLDKFKLHLGDESIKTELRNGDFAEEIITAAKELHVDVIVMGSHSKKWLENILMGSVTEKVLHETAVPLFIIPTKKR